MVDSNCCCGRTYFHSKPLYLKLLCQTWRSNCLTCCPPSMQRVELILKWEMWIPGHLNIAHIPSCGFFRMPFLLVAILYQATIQPEFAKRCTIIPKGNSRAGSLPPTGKPSQFTAVSWQGSGQGLLPPLQDNLHRAHQSIAATERKVLVSIELHKSTVSTEWWEWNQGWQCRLTNNGVGCLWCD